jgi:hypothetical protein
MKEAALPVQTLLTELGLKAWLKTTGGKGLQIVVPLKPEIRYTDVKSLSRAFGTPHRCHGRNAIKAGQRQQSAYANATPPFDGAVSRAFQRQHKTRCLLQLQLVGPSPVMNWPGVKARAHEVGGFNRRRRRKWVPPRWCRHGTIHCASLAQYRIDDAGGRRRSSVGGGGGGCGRGAKDDETEKCC